MKITKILGLLSLFLKLYIKCLNSFFQLNLLFRLSFQQQPHQIFNFVSVGTRNLFHYHTHFLESALDSTNCFCLFFQSFS